MQNKALISLLSLLFLFPPKEVKPVLVPKLLANNIELTIDEKVNSIYNSLDDNGYSLPKFESFTEGLKGFFELKEEGKLKKDILTIIDFSLPSSFKRLWVIDLENNIVLYNSLVAHGSGSGDLFAYSFSNAANSSKSSLGFYSTAEVYNGKHGLSLKLDGLEKGINSNARNRGIVIHGADYASASILNSQHYLGRSQGCPALPIGLSRQIITTIKDKSCLFIYHPSRGYYKSKNTVLMS
jgi:hypothetical protein